MAYAVFFSGLAHLGMSHNCTNCFIYRLCLFMLHADHAWDVITDFATELLETYNLEKDQVRNLQYIAYDYWLRSHKMSLLLCISEKSSNFSPEIQSRQIFRESLQYAYVQCSVLHTPSQFFCYFPLTVRGRIILKRISKKRNMRLWSWFIRLKTGTSREVP